MIPNHDMAFSIPNLQKLQPTTSDGQAFSLYLADDLSGSNETFVAATSASDLELAIPAGTLAGGRSFLLVYCENSLGRAESAAGVRFADWALSLPSTTTTMSSATSSSTRFTSTDTTHTASRIESRTSTSSSSAFADPSLLANTSTSSSFATHTTTTSTILLLPGSSSSSTTTTTSSTTTNVLTATKNVMNNLSFTDLDPVPYELNGTISWSAPADTSAYLHYGVWLLTRTEYTSSVYEVLLTGSQVNDPTTPEGNVPLGTHQLAFAQTRDLGSNGYAQYLTVIPNRKDNDMVASYSEAGFLSIVDLEPLNLGTLQVESVAFTDVDSVATYIQGQVTWRRQDNVDYGFVQAARKTS